MTELTKEEMDKALEPFFQEAMYIMRRIYLDAYEQGLKQGFDAYEQGLKQHLEILKSTNV